MRIATEADLPAIVTIYNSTVPTRQSTADTTEVSLASRTAWFARHTPDSHPILVEEEEGTIVGWVSFQPFHERPAYAHTAEISIYLASAARGRGLGRTLLREAIARAPGLGIRTLIGLVFAHNAPSLALFQKCGFEVWGRLPDVAELDGAEYSLCILGLRVRA